MNNILILSRSASLFWNTSIIGKFADSMILHCSTSKSPVTTAAFTGNLTFLNLLPLPPIPPVPIPIPIPLFPPTWTLLEDILLPGILPVPVPVPVLILFNVDVVVESVWGAGIIVSPPEEGM